MLRSPQNRFEWLLLLSPALIQIAAGIVEAAFPTEGPNFVLQYAVFFPSLVLPMIAAHRLATPRDSLLEGAFMQIFAAIGILLLNIAISFPGCLALGQLSQPNK